MKYQVLFSLKNNEKVLINAVCCCVIGPLRLILVAKATSSSTTEAPGYVAHLFHRPHFWLL